MTILVINCGGSSIKSALFDEGSLERLLDIRIIEIHSTHPTLLIDGDAQAVKVDDHTQALQLLFRVVSEQGISSSRIAAIGHRIIHGGEKLTMPTLIDDAAEQTIEAMIALAPLHNRACLEGVKAARKAFPNCRQISVFDTGFHATLPARSKFYALPDLDTEQPIRRFGFHGISHQFVSNMAADFLQTPINQLRIISCHLGNGCSCTAVDGGRSVETSMGMTPLEGLVMGTRSGDLDPGIMLQLLRDQTRSVEELDALLNQQSGLLGMTGSQDMSVIERRAADGDKACRQAIQIFAHRVRKYIGAYAATMGGVDVIVFTGGIGENSALIRHRIAQSFDFLGASLDEDLNRDANVNTKTPAVEISDNTSRVKILVAATDEELAIATSIKELVNTSNQPRQAKNIPIAISARHVHLTEKSVQALFGSDYELIPDFPLSQPGQYAAKETVTLIGPRNRIDGVRVLGPVRTQDQVEISRSDEFYLGINAPVRASGDTDTTPGITLVGPAGKICLEDGVICALRHIHMHPDDADCFQLKHGDSVSVTIDGGTRDLVFNDVLVRVSERFKLEMHIDTDEANAAELSPNSSGILGPTGYFARLVTDAS